MSHQNTDLGQIKFRKDFSYDKLIPTFVSNNISGNDEIARWVLDRNDIIYRDEPHAPHLYVHPVNKLTRATGIRNNPVLVKTDTLLYTTDSVIQYVDQLTEPEKRLMPDDPVKRKQVLDLYNLFTNELEDKVTKFVYLQMLSDAGLAKSIFTKQVPFNEKLAFKIKYASISNALKNELNLSVHPPAELLTSIRKIFDKVGDLLADGRKYLTGNTLTVADIAFASIGCPFERSGHKCSGVP